MNGQGGACAPRQPQWQHWGELADVGHGAESTARETGAAPREGVDVWGCDEVDAMEYLQNDRHSVSSNVNAKVPDTKGST